MRIVNYKKVMPPKKSTRASRASKGNSGSRIVPKTSEQIRAAEVAAIEAALTPSQASIEYDAQLAARNQERLSLQDEQAEAQQLQKLLTSQARGADEEFEQMLARKIEDGSLSKEEATILRQRRAAATQSSTLARSAKQQRRDLARNQTRAQQQSSAATATAIHDTADRAMRQRAQLADDAAELQTAIQELQQTRQDELSTHLQALRDTNLEGFHNVHDAVNGVSGMVQREAERGRQQQTEIAAQAAQDAAKLDSTIATSVKALAELHSAIAEAQQDRDIELQRQLEHQAAGLEREIRQSRELAAEAADEAYAQREQISQRAGKDVGRLLESQKTIGDRVDNAASAAAAAADRAHAQADALAKAQMGAIDRGTNTALKSAEHAARQRARHEERNVDSLRSVRDTLNENNKIQMASDKKTRKDLRRMSMGGNDFDTPDLVPETPAPSFSSKEKEFLADLAITESELAEAGVKSLSEAVKESLGTGDKAKRAYALVGSGILGFNPSRGKLTMQDGTELTPNMLRLATGAGSVQTKEAARRNPKVAELFEQLTKMPQDVAKLYSQTQLNSIETAANVEPNAAAAAGEGLRPRYAPKTPHRPPPEVRRKIATEIMQLADTDAVGARNMLLALHHGPRKAFAHNQFAELSGYIADEHKLQETDRVRAGVKPYGALRTRASKKKLAEHFGKGFVDSILAGEF